MPPGANQSIFFIVPYFAVNQAPKFGFHKDVCINCDHKDVEHNLDGDAGSSAKAPAPKPSPLKPPASKPSPLKPPAVSSATAPPAVEEIALTPVAVAPKPPGSPPTATTSETISFAPAAKPEQPETTTETISFGAAATPPKPPNPSETSASSNVENEEETISFPPAAPPTTPGGTPTDAEIVAADKDALTKAALHSIEASETLIKDLRGDRANQEALVENGQDLVATLLSVQELVNDMHGHGADDATMFKVCFHLLACVFVCLCVCVVVCVCARARARLCACLLVVDVFSCVRC